MRLVTRKKEELRLESKLNYTSFWKGFISFIKKEKERYGIDAKISEVHSDWKDV